MIVDSTTWRPTRPYVDNKQNSDANTNYSVMEDNQKGGTTPSQDYYNRTNQMIQNYRNSLNSGNGRGYGYGGGGYSVPAYEQPDYSAWFNALTDINNQKYEALKKEMARQKQKADDSANANYSRNLREWQKMYADKRNGQGLSNRLNIGYNRDSALASNREAFDTNNLSAISGRYSDLANLTSYLPNMDSGTIKKIMSNVSGWQ